MRLSKSWIIASKDFAVFRKKKYIIYTIVFVPLLVAFLIPAVIRFLEQRNTSRTSPAELAILLPAFSFFFLILGGYLPSTIASYSLVGEKVEKSLEPLLATPTTDSEILLGKGIAAFIPPLAGVLVGSAIFMTLMDFVTRSKLGYYFFPNWNAVIGIFHHGASRACTECGMECYRFIQGERRSHFTTIWTFGDDSASGDLRLG